MPNLVDHVRAELHRCGQSADDPAYTQSLIAAAAAFDSYPHSSGSRERAVEQLTTLLRFGTLSPLTNDPAEWLSIGDGLWQSTRNPQALSADRGRTYYLLDEVEAAQRAAAKAAPRPMHTAAPAVEQPVNTQAAAVVGVTVRRDHDRPQAGR